jgi:hypothetical protein
MAKAKETGTAVEAADPNAYIREARGVDFVPKSWEEIEEAFADVGGLITFEGSAYAVIDKDRLLDVPFAIVDTRIWRSDQFGRDAISVMLMTKEPLETGRVDPQTGEKEERTLFVINDGSTGIFEQVTGTVGRTGRRGGFVCPNGLRKSEYIKHVTDPFGNEPDKDIQATTYYIQ